MLADKSLSYSVLLGLINPVPVDSIAKVISEINGIPLFDAVRHVVNCWGFLLENSTEEDSKKLLNTLKAVNIEARVVNAAEIVQLPNVTEIKKAVIEPEGLSYFVQGFENKITTEWKNVVLLSAGILKEKIVSYHKEVKGPSATEKVARLGFMATTGIPIGLGKKKEVIVERKETSLYFYLDIFLTNPKVRIRIDPDSFNFDCLKEKKTYSSTTNFRLLLSELSKHSAAALKNQGTEFILSGKPLNLLRYDSPTDLEKESQWMLSVRG